MLDTLRLYLNMLYTSVLVSSALLSLGNAHGVMLAAIGEAGSATSVGFQGKLLIRSFMTQTSVDVF